MPLSLLSKMTVTCDPVGTVTMEVLKAMFWAEIRTVVLPPPPPVTFAVWFVVWLVV